MKAVVQTVVVLVCWQCTTQWVDVLQGLAANDFPDIQHRGIFILASMMAADQEVAYRIVNSNLMELLMAVSKLEEPERKASAKLAEQALKQAEELNLIRSIAPMWLDSRSVSWRVKLIKNNLFMYLYS